MKDSDWQILHELYKTPNITKVAKRIYMTQPSLTKRIQAIEEEFQIKIVNRTTKGVEFTKEGELLATKAGEYLTFMSRVKREIRELKVGKKEVISIGAPYIYSKYVLSEILYNYSKEYPEINFEIHNDSSNLLFRKACDKEIDVAFVRGDYSGDIIQKKVDEQTAYVMTRDYFQLEELPFMTRIDFKTNDRSKELMNRWWLETFDEQAPTGMYAGEYMDVAWQLASKGLGYTCCFLPEHYENTYQLVLTPMTNKDGTLVKRNTWFVYKDTKDMSKALKDFVHYVDDNIILKQ